MKSTDIFKPVVDDLDEINFVGMDFSDMESNDVVNDIFAPVHANISPEQHVDFVHDASVITSGTWREVSAYITNNWNSFNGMYQVSTRGQELHSFTVAR